jgi:hypothetical protein
MRCEEFEEFEKQAYRQGFDLGVYVGFGIGLVVIIILLIALFLK